MSATQNDIKKRRNVVGSQVNILVQALEENRELAAGRVSSSLQGRADLDAEWGKLAELLNSVGGAVKPVSKWKQTWRDLKCAAKKKALAIKKDLRGTGGGPSSSVVLTENDKKVLAIIGPVAVDGLSVGDSFEGQNMNNGGAITIESEDSGDDAPRQDDEILQEPRPPVSQPQIPQNNRRQNRGESSESELIALERERISLNRDMFEFSKERAFEKNALYADRTRVFARIAAALEKDD